MKHIFTTILAFTILAASCSKKQPTTFSTASETKTEQPQPNDAIHSNETTQVIPIPIKLTSSSFSIKNETDSLITIEPTTDYYQEWISKKRSDLFFLDNTLDYPQLDIYVVNNTNQSIDITSLDFIVDYSKIDNIPYVCISDAGENQIILTNESWFNWKTMYIDYSIMKKGEKFNGKYTNRKTIPYFEELMRVDFTQDLVKMGLDMNCVIEHYNDDFLEPGTFSPEERLKIFHPFEIDEEGNGFARIYGKFTFPESKFSTEFYGYFYISPGPYGAEEVESDKFDVQLDYNRQNYKIRYPYKTVLRPGDSERVKLKLNCPRSSNHRFHISINNDNGIVMRTKDIKMYFLNGRFSNLNLKDE